jgi:RES domain-containing protein
MSAGFKLHPHFDEIKGVVEKLSKKGKPFSGVCYRCTEPQFASQIISGLGSQLYGARWTPKNSFPTVYVCETPEAALQEYLARGRRMKLPDHKSLPMVMAWVKVKVANLLDMTDAGIAAVIKSIAGDGQDPLAGRSRPSGGGFASDRKSHQ